NAAFEDAAALLLDGMLDHQITVADLQIRLGKVRGEIFSHVGAADDRILKLPPADAMRALIARLPDGENADTALRLLAAPAVFLPAILRLRRGETPVAPNPSLSQSADILAMLNGTLPSVEQTKALDAYLVTIC